MTEHKKWGAIEAGGTKFNLAIASDPHKIEERLRIETTTPKEVIPACVDFFKSHGPIEGLGLACFGPVDLENGLITQTPKPGWQDFPIVQALQSALNVPVAFDTDVNGAVLAETLWGAAKGLHHAVYVTIGTGVGGGIISGGRIVHGLIHPELGHMRVKHLKEDQSFHGFCPYHGDCLEGLAAGPAIKARVGLAAEDVPITDPSWEIEANYLAQMCFNLSLVLSPQRLILGGGVMQKEGLIELVRAQYIQEMNAYIGAADKVGGVDNYICLPQLGSVAGLLGAFALITKNWKDI